VELFDRRFVNRILTKPRQSQATGRCNIATAEQLSTAHFRFHDLPLVCPKTRDYSAA
jgi:hypothetical protein